MTTDGTAPARRCATAQDATLRVMEARLGSLPPEATEEYLVQLRRELVEWTGSVNIALWQMTRERPTAPASFAVGVQP